MRAAWTPDETAVTFCSETIFGRRQGHGLTSIKFIEKSTIPCCSIEHRASADFDAAARQTVFDDDAFIIRVLEAALDREMVRVVVAATARR